MGKQRPLMMPDGTSEKELIDSASFSKLNPNVNSELKSKIFYLSNLRILCPKQSVQEIVMMCK